METASIDREYALIEMLNGTDMQRTGAKTSANYLACGHTAAIADQPIQAFEDQTKICVLWKRQREGGSVLVMTWTLPRGQAQHECLFRALIAPYQRALTSRLAKLRDHLHDGPNSRRWLIESMNPGAVGTPAPATTATPADPGAVSITDRFLTNLLTLPARVGLVRLVTGPVAGLSPDDANAYTAHSVTVRSLEAAIDEGRGMQESLAQARRVTTLGSVPLIVLSRGLREGSAGEDAK